VGKEAGHKEECIHKSFSLGIVVRYQGVRRRQRDMWYVGVKEMEYGDRVRGNSEYAGLSSITCKQMKGGKAV
jgi:hypothetical protein